MEKFSVTLEKQLNELTTSIVNAVNSLREEIVEKAKTIYEAKVVIENNSVELTNIANVLEDFSTDMSIVADASDTFANLADDIVDCLEDLPNETELSITPINLDEDTPIYETDENGEYHRIG